MNDKQWKDAAKGIYSKREALVIERQALNEEIKVVRTAVREGLVDDKVKKKEIKDQYQEELHKEGYRSYLNGKLKNLKSMESDLMNESGEFNAKQLTFFEVEHVRDEFENSDEAEDEEEEEELKLINT